MPRADWEIVGHQPLPLLPLETQRRIARFLDEKTARIDALIEKKRALLDRLAEKRQALITRAVAKGLNPDAPMKPSGIDWLGDIPAHWHMKRLRHISPKQSVGIVVNRSHYIDDDGHIPFIYGANIGPFEIDWENARRLTNQDRPELGKSRLRERDLVVVRVGEPGVTAVVDARGEGANCASVMFVRRGDCDSDWLACAFNSRIGATQIDQVKYGAAQKQFNIEHAINFWFPVPPVSEQKVISQNLDRCIQDHRRDASLVKTSIDLLLEYRSALITSAVTGQLAELR